MDPESSSGLLLWLPEQNNALTRCEEINLALGELGSAVWPLPMESTPENIRKLLKKSSLTGNQSQQVMDHFLLPRERLLDLVKEAGRVPGTESGGFLSTTDKTHGIVYPQLYQVLQGIDYSRFDRFHVNRSSSQSGVDEVMQVLCGRGVNLQQKIPDRGVVRLEINSAHDQGWIVTYNGDLPHVGSISGASPGAKILMQVFGPAEWEMQYI